MNDKSDLRLLKDAFWFHFLTVWTQFKDQIRGGDLSMGQTVSQEEDDFGRSHAESRFRAIFESEPECVKLIDRDCRLIDMNPAGVRMIEAPSIEAVRGLSILGLIDPKYRQAFRETVDAVFAGASAQIQFEVVGLRGRRLWMDQSAAPLFDRDDPTRVIEMVAVTRDITAQRTAEADLLRATVAEEIGRSKAEFLETISHQLKTPLNQIIGYSELLQEAAQEEGRRSDAADQQRVLAAAANLLAMINHMLSIASVDIRRNKVRMDEYDIGVLVWDAVEATRPMADASGTKLSVEAPHERGFWMCDSSKIDQCLRALLSNAIKSTSGGAVVVKASRDLVEGQSWLQLDVIGAGVGVAPARLNAIFPVLSGASDSKAMDEMGLSLAVARQLARLMGGDIFIAAERTEGAHFRLRVPAEFSPDTAEISAMAQTS